MSTPPPAAAEPNRAWCRAIVDELVLAGVGHVCLSPGSRSTPLALAAAERAADGARPGRDPSLRPRPSSGEKSGESRSREVEAARADTAGFELSVHYDERSAGFFALGYARATGRPAACICTSGTAAANYLPAVVEAHYSRAPLVLLTADRPPELRDTGAWQVIDQTKLYGAFARWYAELGLPEGGPEALRYARSVAARAVALATGRPAGPVHVNVPLREPFPPWRPDEGVMVGTGAAESAVASAAAIDAAADPDSAQIVSTLAVGAPLPPPPPRPGPTTHGSERHPPAAALDAVAERIRAAPRGLILAGRLNHAPGDDHAAAVTRLAAASGYPILAEPTGGLRFGPHDRSHVVTGYDAYLRDPAWTGDPASAPDLVLRVGASFTWRMVSDTLARFPEAHTIVVDPDGTWDDPARVASERFEVEPATLCDALAERLEARPLDAATRAAAEAWRGRWIGASERAAEVRRRMLDVERAHNPALDTVRDPAPSAAWIPETVLDAIGSRRGLVWVANSMAVRDIDTFTGSRPEPIAVMAARGAAGIDGTLSQAIGAACGWQDGALSPDAAATRPAVLITGDLAFLHDLNGLSAAAGAERPQLAIVVVDDDGGGIFEYLPVAGGERGVFERCFATPPRVDIAAACAAFGVPCETVLTPLALEGALGEAIGAGGVRAIRVPVDRASNTAAHRAYWAAVVDSAGHHSPDREDVAAGAARPAPTPTRPPITALAVKRLDAVEDDGIETAVVEDEGMETAGVEAHAGRAPLVLLHGFTGDAGTWRPFAQALLACWRTDGRSGRPILAVDLVGHGASPDPGVDEAHAVPAQVESLVAAMEGRGVQRAIWCGYSMGGRIALALAAAHPERVAGLVLVGATAGIADPGERAARLASDAAAADSLLAGGLEAFVERWMSQPLFATQAALGAEHVERMRAQRLRNRPESLARSLRAAGTGAMEPLVAALPSIACPALVVAGALDPKFSDIADRLAARMPRARAVRIAGAGHAVQIEAPGELAREFAAFESECEAW